jgi:putative ABC transport system permease protein
MTLAGLSFAYLKDRALTTALNILLLALGVASLVILLNFSNQLQDRFTRDAQGIDLVVGAKGSPLQLILSSIYHIDAPTGNVPLDAIGMLRRDPTVKQVIPLALGDNFRGYRIVGTELTYPAHYGARIADGRMWAEEREVVLGSAVAAGTGAGLGQQFAGSHGLGVGGHSHAERPFIVVGRLAPTGSVVDRLILTSVESVWDVHGIAHDHAQDGHAQDGHAGHDHGDDKHAHDEADKPPVGADASARGELKPEVTAILVKYASPLAAVRLPGFINRQTEMQSAVPAVEITRLLSLVGVGLDAMRALALLLMVTAGLSIFVALYTALRQRQADMAMLRVIGASKAEVFGQIMLEGLILAAAGAVLGLGLGHLVLAGASAEFRQLQSLGFDPWRIDPGELWIVAAALVIGVVAALIPAIQVFRADIADTLANSN